MMRALGSPSMVYAALPALISRANAVTRVETRRVGPGVVEIVAAPRIGADLPYACWSRVGFFDAIPTAWDRPRASVEHPECIHRHGAAECRYVVRHAEATPWALSLLLPGATGERREVRVKGKEDAVEVVELGPAGSGPEA